MALLKRRFYDALVVCKYGRLCYRSECRRWWFLVFFFSFHPLFLSLWGRDPPVWGRDPPVWGRDPPVWGRDPRSGVVTPVLGSWPPDRLGVTTPWWWSLVFYRSSYFITWIQIASLEWNTKSASPMGLLNRCRFYCCSEICFCDTQTDESTTDSNKWNTGKLGWFGWVSKEME